MKQGSRIKKATVKREAEYAYLVRFHQYNEVEVKRQQVTRVTKTHVSYINDYGVEFTLEKRGPSHRWFPTRKRANRFAERKLNDRIEFYSSIVQDLQNKIKQFKSK